MAYSLIAHRADGLGANGGTSGAIDTSGANLITLAIASDATNNIVAGDISDSKGNTGWTLAGAVYEGTNLAIQIFYKVSPVIGASHTFTATRTGSVCSMAAAAWLGSATTPMDLFDGAAADSGTSLSTPSGITPSENNALVISALGIGGSGTITDPAGLTRTDLAAFSGGNNYGVVMAYVIQTTAALVDPNWVSDTDESHSVVLVSFKNGSAPVNGGGGSPTDGKILIAPVGFS
jgi:hypothetical protein